MLALDPSKRVTLVEALAHPWFNQALPEVDIVVGGKHVRSVMQEFNARRAGLTLRNLRQRGKQVRKRLSETAEDIMNAQSLMPKNWPHVSAPLLATARRTRRTPHAARRR